MEDSIDSDPCGFCRDTSEKEVIYLGKVEFGKKCRLCGATSQHGLRKLRNQALSVTPPGFENTPIGLVSKMLKDPLAFFKPGRNKDEDNPQP